MLAGRGTALAIDACDVAPGARATDGSAVAASTFEKPLGELKFADPVPMLDSATVSDCCETPEKTTRAAAKPRWSFIRKFMAHKGMLLPSPAIGRFKGLRDVRRQRGGHDDDPAPSSADLENETPDRGDVLAVILIDLVENQVRRHHAQRLQQEPGVDRRGHPHEMIDGADQNRGSQKPAPVHRVFAGLFEHHLQEGRQPAVRV